MTKNNNSDYDIIFQDNQKLIFFLVLFFKDFTFDKELLTNFNLTKKQIQQISEIYSNFGFLLLRQFSDLDEISQEALFKTIPDPLKFYNQNPKIYILSQKGREFAYSLSEKIKQKTKEDVFLQDLFNMVKQKTESFLLVKKRLENEENLVLSRKVTYPNGITLEKPTIKAREIKQAIEEIKKVKFEKIQDLKDFFNKETIKTENKLKKINPSYLDKKQEINSEKKFKVLRNSINYKGVFSNLPKNQILKLAEGIDEKEVKLIDKKYGKNGNKWEIDKQTNYWSDELEKATFVCFGTQGHDIGGVLEDDEFEELLEEYLVDEQPFENTKKNKKIQEEVIITKDNIFDVLGIDEK